MKNCSGCKIDKELSEFHRQRSVKCGYKSKCKDCTKSYREPYKEERNAKKRAKNKALRDEVDPNRKRLSGWDNPRNEEGGFISRPVAINGVVYESVSQASKFFVISAYLIRKWINSSEYNMLLPFPFKSNKKAVTINGVQYKTKTEAGLSLGVHSKTITKRIESKSLLYIGYTYTE